MMRKVIFSGVLGVSVVISISFYGCFALKGEEAGIEVESFLPPIFLYNSEGLRDPFIPLVGKEEKKTREVVEKPEKTGPTVEKPKSREIVTHSGYRLIGLVWDKKGVFALIEGKDGKWIVKKGDHIGEFQVFEVEPKKGEVTLISGEKIVELRMRE